MADLIQLAERTVKLVTKLGASHCDVLVAVSTHIVAEIEKSSIKQASEISDIGIGIRAFKNGCSGFAYSTGHDFAVVRKVAGLAVSQAGAGTPDPDFRDLPAARRPSRVQGLFDKRLAHLESDEVVEMAITLSDFASADRRVASVNAGVGVGRGEVALANSNGVSNSQKMTAFETSAEVVAKSGKSMFSAMDAGSTRRLDLNLIERVGKSAEEHALMGLKQTRLSTGDFPVVFDPLSIGYIFMSAIGGGASAESVQRKRSYLAGRLGQSIGSSLLTVADDPTLAWSSGSYSFDGEGVPARKNVLIDKGTLESYLHDSYTSGKDSIESTGNASRGGALWSFRRPPSISSSNIVVEGGDCHLDEMVRGTGKGVFLRATFDYPNLATGEFSGLMMESYLIEKGEIGPSIKQSTIGINLIDMFSRIDMVGKDAVDAFGVRTPPLRISSARIAGSA
jgi:PmbA protein